MLVARKLCGTMLFTKRNHQSCSRTQTERACMQWRKAASGQLQSTARNGTHYWKRAQAVQCSGSYTVLNESDCTLTQPRCQWQWSLVISCNGGANLHSLEMSISCLQTKHWNRLVPQLRIALEYICRHGAKAGSVLMNHRSLEPARTPAALQRRGRCMAMDFECVKVSHPRFVEGHTGMHLTEAFTPMAAIHGCNLAGDGAVSFGQTMSNPLQRHKPVSCANAAAAT